MLRVKAGVKHKIHTMITKDYLYFQNGARFTEANFGLYIDLAISYIFMTS
jgi:hypothetical protein